MGADSTRPGQARFALWRGLALDGEQHAAVVGVDDGELGHRLARRRRVDRVAEDEHAARRRGRRWPTARRAPRSPCAADASDRSRAASALLMAVAARLLARSVRLRDSVVTSTVSRARRQLCLASRTSPGPRTVLGRAALGRRSEPVRLGARRGGVRGGGSAGGRGGVGVVAVLPPDDEEDADERDDDEDRRGRGGGGQPRRSASDRVAPAGRPRRASSGPARRARRRCAAASASSRGGTRPADRLRPPPAAPRPGPAARDRTPPGRAPRRSPRRRGRRRRARRARSGVGHGRGLGRSGGGSRVPLGVGEQRGERGPAPGDARADGTGGDAEHLRDLGVVEPAEVAEHDRRPELERDLGERGVDVEAVADGLARSTVRGRRARAGPSVRRRVTPPDGACVGAARRGLRWSRSGRPRSRTTTGRRSGAGRGPPR